MTSMSLTRYTTRRFFTAGLITQVFGGNIVVQQADGTQLSTPLPNNLCAEGGWTVGDYWILDDQGNPSIALATTFLSQYASG